MFKEIFVAGLKSRGGASIMLLMVVIPAIRRRSGQGFDSPHLHLSAQSHRASVLRWGCTGFDRAGESEQATREVTDVIRTNP